MTPPPPPPVWTMLKTALFLSGGFPYQTIFKKNDFFSSVSKQIRSQYMHSKKTLHVLPFTWLAWTWNLNHNALLYIILRISTQLMSRVEFWEVIGRRWKETWMSFRFRSPQYTAWLPLKDCWRKIFQHRCHIMFIFRGIMSMWHFLSRVFLTCPIQIFCQTNFEGVIVGGCSD